MANDSRKPVLIIGAGISGLILAQHLKKQNIPYQVFERDTDLKTRGIGWGLTLHWSLPALRELLPSDVFDLFPQAYVDRVAVKEGASSRFPFYDLSTGELKAAVPPLPEAKRIRVTRERFRQVLSTGIDITWGKAIRELNTNSEAGEVTAEFEDGTSYVGCLAVACDGIGSRARKALMVQNSETYHIPIRMLGLRAECSPERARPIRELDPFFLQGTSSKNNSFIYMSVLDAPNNNENSPDSYSYQLCLSWPYKSGFLGKDEPLDVPATEESKRELVRQLADTWSEPFKSFAQDLSTTAEIKSLDLQDFVPPLDFRSQGRTVLMGDAIHGMAMYRGEGANHAIWDVFDFSQHVVSHLTASETNWASLREALDQYETAVVTRTRPGVLASRQACLDAHDFSKVVPTSPLLTKRERITVFEEVEA